jgi:hypothetical protein
MSATKSITVPVNSDIHAVLLQDGNQKIQMIGQNSRGLPQKNCGFLLPSNPNVLRTLGNALHEMATHLESFNAQSILNDIENAEVVLNEARYTIEISADYKGQFYFYSADDDYASPDFHHRADAISAATHDLNTPADQRAGIRI